MCDNVLTSPQMRTFLPFSRLVISFLSSLRFLRVDRSSPAILSSCSLLRLPIKAGVNTFRGVSGPAMRW